VENSNPVSEARQQPTRKSESGLMYALKFRSRAESNRIRKAAKRERKTLREFLLDSADKAAHEAVQV
jgi:uncharacterized protein (DUF1778 family)